MRYFQIVITNPSNGYVYTMGGAPGYGFALVPPGNGISTFTSLNSGALVSQPGSTNMSAQMVEMDITVTPLHSPDSLTKPWVRIHGVSLAMVGQASDLNGAFIAIYGGMAAGLPLANFNQASLLASGQVLQAVGEWMNQDQSLTLFLAPGGSATAYNAAAHNTNGTLTPSPVTANQPANLIFVWNYGQSLMSAITNCLQPAFPSLSIQGAISPSLVWGSQAPKVAYFETLIQFATWINQVSRSVIAGPTPATFVYTDTQDSAYLGVNITLNAGVLLITDYSTATNPKQIVFTDLIGQPNWAGVGQAQAVCVMRGDISVSDFVAMPQALGTSNFSINTQNPGANPFNIPSGPGGQGGYALQKNSPSFSGNFLVTRVRHLGNSRSPQATGWVTVMDLSFTQPNSGAALIDSLPVVYKGSGNTFGFTVPS